MAGKKGRPGGNQGGGRRVARDLTGEVFGNWTVVRYSPKKAGYWLCACRCGATRHVQATELARIRPDGRCAACKGFTSLETVRALRAQQAETAALLLRQRRPA